MGVLADHQIRARLKLPDDNPRRLRIEPFAEATKHEGRISYGLSHYGYDIRLGQNFTVFTAEATSNEVIEVSAQSLEVKMPLLANRGRAEQCYGVSSVVIPPNGFCLAESLESVRIPRDCIAQMDGKSTLARCGICLNTTKLEPEWYGVITLEIANLLPLPVRIYAGQGIGQIVFYRADEMCERSYADKPHAAYQGQTGLTLPRV